MKKEMHLSEESSKTPCKQYVIWWSSPDHKTIPLYEEAPEYMKRQYANMVKDITTIHVEDGFPVPDINDWLNKFPLTPFMKTYGGIVIDKEDVKFIYSRVSEGITSFDMAFKEQVSSIKLANQGWPDLRDLANRYWRVSHD